MMAARSLRRSFFSGGLCGLTKSTDSIPMPARDSNIPTGAASDQYSPLLLDLVPCPPVSVNGSSDDETGQENLRCSASASARLEPLCPRHQTCAIFCPWSAPSLSAATRHRLTSTRIARLRSSSVSPCKTLAYEK